MPRFIKFDSRTYFHERTFSFLVLHTYYISAVDSGGADKFEITYYLELIFSKIYIGLRARTWSAPPVPPSLRE